MRPRRSRILLITIIVAFAFIAAVAGRQAWQMRKFAQLQACFPGGEVSPSFEAPFYISASAWESLWKWVFTKWGREPWWSDFYLRMQWICNGTPTGLLITTGKIEAGAGVAVTRFPSLNYIKVIASQGVDEVALADLCAGLRQLPRLRGLYFGDVGVTDAGVAPLAGHPGVSTVIWEDTVLTDRSAAMLATLPALSVLDIYQLLTAEEKKAIRRALEHRPVTVTIE